MNHTAHRARGYEEKAELHKTPKAGRKTEDPTPADVEIVAPPSQDGDTLLGRRRRPQGTAGFDTAVIRPLPR